MNKLIKQKALILLIVLTPTCFAADFYQCNITEVIQAKFKHGKWVKTDITDGKAVYFIEVNGDRAELIEKKSENNNLYPIQTSCHFVGGTAGYVCDEFLKLVPNAERYNINFYPSLNEITISASYTMKEFIAYSKESRNKNSKYFNDITLSITESYGKCIRK